MTDAAGVARRAAWSERWPRQSHDLVFTPIGGRRRDGGFACGSAADRTIAARYLSQAALALPRTDGRPHDVDVDYWVTVCRKILQRGSRPPLSRRLDDLLPLQDSHPSRESLLRAVSALTEVADVDPAYELHPRWERPFWDAARRLAPHAAAWIIPQAPLEGLLAGELGEAVTRRWVDFLYAPPGMRPTVFEIDGGGHERRREVDHARDRELDRAGVAVLRSDGPQSVETGGPLLARLIADEQRFATAPAEAAELTSASVPPRLALAVVEAVELGLLPKGGPWSIDVVDPDGLAERVVGASLDPLRAVSELWRLNVVPRSVQVNGRLIRLAGEVGRDEPTPPGFEASVRIRFEPRTPFFAPLSGTVDVPEITIRPAGVPADLTWLPGVTAERRAMRATEDTDLHLRLLLEDLFGHSEFREGQLPSLRQAPRGRLGRALAHGQRQEPHLPARRPSHAGHDPRRRPARFTHR